MNSDAFTPIAWMDVLETGIQELDEDHRTLIEQCNALTAALMQAGVAWSEIVAATRHLAETCIEHFRSEEAVLDRTQFPRRDRHMAQHREMERRFKTLVDFLAGVDGSSPEHWKSAEAVRTTLVDILFRHDLDYKSHLQHAAGR